MRPLITNQDLTPITYVTPITYAKPLRTWRPMAAWTAGNRRGPSDAFLTG